MCDTLTVKSPYVTNATDSYCGHFCHRALFDRFCAPAVPTGKRRNRWPRSRQPPARFCGRRNGRACPCRQRVRRHLHQHRVPLRNSRDQHTHRRFDFTAGPHQQFTQAAGQPLSGSVPPRCSGHYSVTHRIQRLPSHRVECRHGKSRADLNSCLQLHHDSCSASRLSRLPELPTQAWARGRIFETLSFASGYGSPSVRIALGRTAAPFPRDCCRVCVYQ